MIEALRKTEHRQSEGESIRVRGLVQGVGFRPTVWRLARALGVRGEVLNDGDGVLIHAWAARETLDALVEALQKSPPPLARIDAIERSLLDTVVGKEDFIIVASEASAAHTGVVPDAATCPECLSDTLDFANRRYRYPFTNCTHCGPRFSIIDAIPYDRANTSMAVFAMCPDCTAEYGSPADRRFHAQPNACPICGPATELVSRVPEAQSAVALDDVELARGLLERGEIVAVKGLGGFHLACDATNEVAVRRLRERKRRYDKPLALMARDLGIIRRYCSVSPEETAVLQGPQAPIVILETTGPECLPEDVAPGQHTLGFMLPYTPLHHLLLQHLDRPIVLTSGNLSEEPQCIDNDDAHRRLGNIADHFLRHDREIFNRVDDSVVRVMAGRPRLLRRARGYSPAPMTLPPGFDDAAELLALGGELKNTFCLVKDGRAILSQHMGDLEDASTFADYRKNLELYARLFEHTPEYVVVDKHPEYLSTKLGRHLAEADGLDLDEVQHHHAHIAACMAENGVRLDAGPVLGVALDGLGLGDDGTIWGGEFLLADYCGSERLGAFEPVAMLGGPRAIQEPWRNTFAHLSAAFGWPKYEQAFGDLALTRFLQTKPITTLQRVLDQRINSPLASSCGRLFDAVAAALGICREWASYEGQAAIELEAQIDERALDEEPDAMAYPFAPSRQDGTGLLRLDMRPMWETLLRDLVLDTPAGVISARFHKGLALAIVGMVTTLAKDHVDNRFETVALSGGVFQNKTLLEQVVHRLEARGFQVLTHRHVPSNDGGLALGQAAVAAARIARRKRERRCV